MSLLCARACVCAGCVCFLYFCCCVCDRTIPVKGLSFPSILSVDFKYILHTQSFFSFFYFFLFFVNSTNYRLLKKYILIYKMVSLLTNLINSASCFKVRYLFLIPLTTTTTSKVSSSLFSNRLYLENM